MNPFKPKVVYLDQNIWIELARVYYGKRNDQASIDVLQKLYHAVYSGTAILPLSFGHLYETRKRHDPESRKSLAKVMVELSQGWAIASPSYLVPKQMEIAVAAMYGNSMKHTIRAIGRSFFEFDFVGQFYDEIRVARENIGVLKMYMEHHRLEILKQLLTGENTNFTPESDPGFQAAFKLLDSYVKSLERFRKEDKEALSLEKQRRLYVVQLAVHYSSVLEKCLKQQNESLTAFPTDIEKLVAFFTTIPSLNIEVELVLERNKHWDRKIQPNDVLDIQSLSAAIPYCDAVVTEKFMFNLIKRKKARR